MIEAVKTTASAGEIWTIVIVAVGTLAFWLGAVAWADMHPFVRDRQVQDMEGPVLGGTHLGSGGRSVSPNREAPSVLTDVDDMPYDQREYQPERDEAAQWQGGIRGTGEPWVPVQRKAEPEPAPPQPHPAQEMPTQRTGDSDQPEPTTAGSADAGASPRRPVWPRRPRRGTER